MNQTKLLLRAYYEALYDKLEAGKELLRGKIEPLLRQELAKVGLHDLDRAKYTAYRDACLAFVDERLEMYNPVGIQYTFDRIAARQAAELELQLNWYDSTEEFKALMQLIREQAKERLTDEALRQITEGIIEKAGAFPDNSIISTYQAKPALTKLPDYIVACAIEEIISKQEDMS